MGDAKRVDLDALRTLARAAKPLDTLVLRDAIVEIEAARAAPPPSPTPGLADVLDRFGARLSVLAEAVVTAWDERGRSGPSRAERLVAYRRAALGALVDSPIAFRDNGTGTPPLRGGVRAESCAASAEMYAHAMLAAEREPQP